MICIYTHSGWWIRDWHSHYSYCILIGTISFEVLLVLHPWNHTLCHGNGRFCCNCNVKWIIFHLMRSKSLETVVIVNFPGILWIPQVNNKWIFKSAFCSKFQYYVCRFFKIYFRIRIIFTNYRFFNLIKYLASVGFSFWILYSNI